jgi:hypothetical protein
MHVANEQAKAAEEQKKAEADQKKAQEMEVSSLPCAMYEGITNPEFRLCTWRMKKLRMRKIRRRPRRWR